MRDDNGARVFIGEVAGERAKINNWWEGSYFPRMPKRLVVLLQ